MVKNYTGDRLNFGVAAEMARAEGLAVEMILVEDDVALRGGAGKTGARGLAGTVFIHKIVGAAAAEGKSLPELAVIRAPGHWPSVCVQSAQRSVHTSKGG